MNKLQSGILLIALIVFCSCAATQHVSETPKSVTAFSYAPDEILPVDRNITIGKLDNDFTYYIRENHKPENRMELRLVIKAGSVLEDDDQQGLAHFTEHMAFNGTKNFKKYELVNYLESIGMRFGPDLNAYTGFDETVYMLQVPADSVHIVETAFQILEEWAHNIAFEDEEIDKERGVILEEWRSGRGAQARMRDKQYPVLFKDSRYAERLPIGKMNVVENFSYDSLRRFYRDWYRPDLMAVIAVGDFDGKWIEKLIKKHFSRLSSVKNLRERIEYEIPDHDKTLFAIATDPEATYNSVSIYYKHNVIPENTVGDYRTNLVEALYNGMLNQRLFELTKESDPPFLQSTSAKGRIVRSKEVYYLATSVKENGIPRGLEALMTEAARVRKYGFTPTELERQKQEMLRFIEQIHKERDKTESSAYVSEYARNFLTGEPLPGIEYEYEIYKRYIPGISLGEVNDIANEWITDHNRVILVNAPEKSGVSVPTEEDILAIMDSVSNKDIEPYVDSVSDQPLVDTTPAPAAIVSEHNIEEIGVTEWRLSNGIRVVLKPTDFKNDEILFTAFSPGGYSLVSDEKYIAAATASTVIDEGGAGMFNLIELTKMLSGKVVSVSPWINELDEGISGSVSPQDMETMFQLIYLYFTSPRMDSTAFASLKSRMKGYIENRSASPETAFSDTVSVTMAQYHYRARPWTLELLEEMDLNTSYSIYRERFKDAGDFTFFFVGNFSIENFQPLVKTYIGGLPSINRTENWKDSKIHYPKGVITKEVKAGIEPKSMVNIDFTGTFQWNYQNRYDMTAMVDVLRIKLRESLREDLGGTYGVSVSHSMSHYPDEEYRITISFGCAPQRVDELTSTVFSQLDSIKTFGTTSDYLAKVKEMHKRQRETDLRENSFWLSVLRFYYYHDENPTTLFEFDEKVENLSLDIIRETANKYFDMKNYVKVVLYPMK
ncbi:MAG: insulinase family protein [Candidatus Latescibacteria bacterium]|nr:insulinase family protein [Candidatus Latescibacterota bacterium]